MKNRVDNSLKWIVGGAFIVILMFLVEAWIASKITQGLNESIMWMITILIYSIVISAKLIQSQKLDKADREKMLEETKNKLTSKFKKVMLKDSEFILAENFECQARIDENGKIICKINLEVEAEMDSPEEFLEHFYLD